MNIVRPVIQNGAGRLILTESVLFDSQHPFYIDVPTVSGKPFRIQIKIELLQGNFLASARYTKATDSIIEITGTFYELAGSYIGLKELAPIKIAGGTYHLIYSVTRLLDFTFRAEVSLYEV